MKKSTLFAISTAIGAAIGAGTYGIVKRQQKKAKKMGIHIPYGTYEAMVKRPLDFLLSGTALVLLSPVMGFTALLVRWKLGSPVLFTQLRPGLQGEIFKIYKFRTMTEEYGADGELLSDAERLTDFGKMLRSTSLDELPELINILRGDMSIVGPRPLLVEYLEKYSDTQKHRHDVRPGLTGLAQVSGRNGLSWEEKFEDDLKYVRKITFLGDLKIICQTVMAVLKKEGINADEKVTMPKFLGNTESNEHMMEESWTGIE